MSDVAKSQDNHKVGRNGHIGIGIVGAGFLAATRARCYARVGAARLVAVTARTEESSRAYAEHHDIPVVSEDFEAMLARDDVDVVDLCVPNHLHRPMTEAAAAAGKHVICTKPLTAYVGQDLEADVDEAAIGARDRGTMRSVAIADAKAMVEATEAAGVQLMYAENWVYAPAIRRAVELVCAARGPVVEMRGWESHNGSHSPYAKSWKYNGGGALIRLGAHPIGAMLYLKRREGMARSGTPIRPVAVTADVADLSRVRSLDTNASAIATGWKDVENWGCAIIRFEDGSRGIAYGSDNMLGGMESRLEILGADHHLKCNLSPNDMLRAYAPNETTFGEEYIMEKSSTGVGWSTPMPDEDGTSGHLDMCRAFVDGLLEGRPTESDGRLGLEVTRVVYAAYLAATEETKVEL